MAPHAIHYTNQVLRAGGGDSTRSLFGTPSRSESFAPKADPGLKVIPQPLKATRGQQDRRFPRAVRSRAQRIHEIRPMRCTHSSPLGALQKRRSSLRGTNGGGQVFLKKSKSRNMTARVVTWSPGSEGLVRRRRTPKRWNHELLSPNEESDAAAAPGHGAPAPALRTAWVWRPHVYGELQTSPVWLSGSRPTEAPRGEGTGPTSIGKIDLDITAFDRNNGRTT